MYSYFPFIRLNFMSRRLNHLHTILQRTYQPRRFFIMGTRNQTSAGLIVIGDEILKGQVKDTIIPFLAKNLFSLGIRLSKVSVIPDDINVISNEVKEFHENYTFVFTSGGIGPTHDDMTFEAVGRAFSEGTTYNPELKELVWNFFSLDTKDKETVDATLKLAKIPESAVLRYGVDPKTGARHPYPVVTVKNIFIFPGIPSLFERAFGIIKDSLCQNDTVQRISRNVFLKIPEVQFTTQLNQIVRRFGDDVIFGSYPELANSYYKVRISVESVDPAVLEQAVDAIKMEARPDNVVDFEPDPILNASRRVYELAETDSPLGAKVKGAIDVIESAVKQYSDSELCIGFNGGKDCTALLHLVHAVYQKVRKNEETGDQSVAGLQGLYIRSRWPFPEVEQFIESSVKSYNVDLIRLNGQIKACLATLKEQKPVVQAVFMGSRSTDPRCDKLMSFCMTDPSWPQFMRINPILDWSYGDVWSFLRTLNVPYCQLYDRGYTSLGSMENTHPNPTLRHVTDNGIVEYRPAFDLENSDSERSGRG